MKTSYHIGIIICWVFLASSCKKFLNVKPIDQLSGNSFWQNEQDAQAGINGAYSLLEKKFLASTLYNDGDFRAGNWNWFNKLNLATLASNNLLSADLNAQDATADPKNSWSGFYQAIAAANICIDRIPGISDPSFSSSMKRQLVAEAKFIRAFTYFWMVRLYGDVPLQNDPYNTDNKPRTDMIQVMDTCINDLNSCKDDLPTEYTDPTNRAVRATKGAALALMAHMYMWNAGFDKANQKADWQQAADLTKQVMDLGVYELLPYTDLESVQTIFKGRSKEGIFELSLDINYGTQFHSLICQWTLHMPYINSSTSLYGGYGCEITPEKTMLDKLYPPGTPDSRFTLWFDDPYSTKNPQSAMFLKYSSVSDPAARNYDANFILMRYAGIVLLRAEALADLGQDGEAVTYLNMIRKRASTPTYSGSGQALKDAIFLEREKELMGEGWLWYDLVRTGRVLDQNSTEDYLTPTEFEAGAWTWPIPASAMQLDPLVKQTQYWTN